MKGEMLHITTIIVTLHQIFHIVHLVAFKLMLLVCYTRRS